MFTLAARMLTWITAAALLAGAPPCPHRYFPLEEGLRLTYRAGGSTFTVSYSDVKPTEGGGQTAKLQLQLRNQASAETTATCAPGGVRTEGAGLEGAALASAGMRLKVLSSEGVALPPEAELVQGRPWKNRLELELQPPEKAALPGGLRPVLRTTFVKEAEVVGTEEVTVGAGTFEALKVRNTTTALAGSTGSARTLESLAWFAPGVGIVKIVTGDSVDLELMEIQRAPPSERGRAARAPPGASPPPRGRAAPPER